MKQKLQQLEIQIFQAKQLKKQKVGELKRSPQSGMETLRFGTANSSSPFRMSLLFQKDSVDLKFYFL